MVPGLLTIDSPAAQPGPTADAPGPPCPPGLPPRYRWKPGHGVRAPVRRPRRCTGRRRRRRRGRARAWEIAVRRTTARLLGTSAKTTLGHVSGSQVATQTVRYSNGCGCRCGGGRSVSAWQPCWPKRSPWACATSRGGRPTRCSRRSPSVCCCGWAASRSVISTGADVELWAGQAHLPASVVTRSAVVPRSAKSAALGRQLDPRRVRVAPQLGGADGAGGTRRPDDPTPYWLISTRHPDRVLSALKLNRAARAALGEAGTARS